MSADIDRLIDIMAALRTPETGCPWDLEQDFQSIAPYTIEEAYEVAEAIRADDMPALCDELGDLLLQVVFHARMAEQLGGFGLQDVIDGICAKMERRHPHIFGGDSEYRQTRENWEALKEEERKGNVADPSAMAGVAHALPALMRAEKLQKRAARTGFDWPDLTPVIAKVEEEIAEVQAAQTPEHRAEEIGDLLFAVVNLARHIGVDAEVALRNGNAKFEARFRMMEALAGDAFGGLSLDDKEALWQQVKKAGSAE